MEGRVGLAEVVPPAQVWWHLQLAPLALCLQLLLRGTKWQCQLASRVVTQINMQT